MLKNNGFHNRHSPFSRPFSPASFFANGEQGWWFDPSNSATLFQDSAGTTPVTAVEQPVGLQLDLSKGLVLGAELLSNPGPGFTTTTGWTSGRGATLSIVSGTIRATNTAAFGQAYATNTTVVGTTYKVTVSATNPTTTFDIILGSTGQESGILYQRSNNPAGTYTFFFTATTTTSYLTLGNSGATAGNSFDLVSATFKAVPGNHRFQTTSANRPVVSARVNLLTKTEDFSNAVWAKLTGGTGSLPIVTPGFPDPFGGNTAFRVQLNCGAGTASGDYSVLRQTGFASATLRSIYIKSNTGSSQTLQLANTAVANSPLVTATTTFSQVSVVTQPYNVFDLATSGDTGATRQIDVIVWGADLRFINQGVGLPAYQRVNTSTDYDSTGFPIYIKPNGSNQFMVTNSINFSATDKMTVWQGVRKLNNSGISTFTELSTDGDSNSGAFSVAIPVNALQYYFQIRASGRLAGSVSSGYAAPRTDVVTSLMNIAGATAADELKARVNGADLSLSYSGDASAGTGNFGNYPAYFYMRAGTSFPFNGHDYGSIARGAASTAAQITAGETYINSKTKAY